MSNPDHTHHIFTYFYDGQWYFSHPYTHCLISGDPPFQSKDQALEAGESRVPRS